MVSIICLKWGREFGPEYVNKLYNEVEKYVTIPHEFICFTDNPGGVDSPTMTLPDLGLPGWWNKLWLFNTELPVTNNRIFYLDLDTVILGNIDHIVSNLNKGFYMLRDFYRADGYGSGLMSWDLNEQFYLWELFQAHQNKPLQQLPGHGDQGFIEAFAHKPIYTFQDEFPGYVTSYKVHRLRDKVTDGKIMCFHGKPRPHEVPGIWNNR